MLRKINFTERVRIPRSAIAIRLRRDRDGILVFESKLNLKDLPIPRAARVYLEAHYKASYMRFDCGTAGTLVLPTDRRLTKIDSRNVVHFRLKIVDEREGKRIIALADNVTVSEREGGSGALVSLLPVNYEDLGDLIWKLDFDEVGGVTLVLNSRIDAIDHLARSDRRFFALVYPAVVREILTRILLINSEEGSGEGDEWSALWICWATGLTTSPLPPIDDSGEREQWIDEIVDVFCRQHATAGPFLGKSEEES